MNEHESLIMLCSERTKWCSLKPERRLIWRCVRAETANGHQLIWDHVIFAAEFRFVPNSVRPGVASFHHVSFPRPRPVGDAPLRGMPTRGAWITEKFGSIVLQTAILSTDRSLSLMKKRSERRKHCPLAVCIRRCQKFSPCHRPPLPGGAGRPKFNQ